MLARCRLLAVLIAAGFISGCALPYYLQAVGGQLQLLRKRTPIDTAITDPALDQATKSRLMTVAELRNFAVTDLGLPENRSYTSYVDLGRDYVVWNVIAAEEFSVEPVRWCFLFAGCVAYRGYFDRGDAERFASELETEGFDIYSGGSGAYSTLGYFADPVLNTMLADDEAYVAGVLFHELSHQKLYIKGDSEFNEAFATTIEEHGVDLWLRQRGTEERLAAYQGQLDRRAAFAELVVRQQARLRSIYASESSPDEKRAAKVQAFATMREEYGQLKASWNGATDYDVFFERPLNNAALAAVATYRRWLPALRWRLEVLGLDAFYREVEKIAELPQDERMKWLEAWEQGRSAPGDSIVRSR